MKLFSKFVVGFGILLHQKIVERLNEEVDCDRQSSPPDERTAETCELDTSSGHYAQNPAENSPTRESSGETSRTRV
jgi:hypothetical protein